jgi:hypothetical protein
MAKDNKYLKLYITKTKDLYSGRVSYLLNSSEVGSIVNIVLPELCNRASLLFLLFFGRGAKKFLSEEIKKIVRKYALEKIWVGNTIPATEKGHSIYFDLQFLFNQEYKIQTKDLTGFIKKEGSITEHSLKYDFAKTTVELPMEKSDIAFFLKVHRSLLKNWNITQ